MCDNTCRKNYQIALFQPDPDPIIGSIPYIKEAIAFEYISNFFVFVEVLVEEHLHFLFVNGAHLLWRDNDLIPVLVGSLGGDLVDRGDRRAVVIEDSELGEIIGAHFAS